MAAYGLGGLTDLRSGKSLPFEEDYRPPIAETIEQGKPLTTDQEGRPLGAQYLAGRKVKGGDDTGLSTEEIEDIIFAFTGSPVEHIAANNPAIKALSGKAAGLTEDFRIIIRDDIDKDSSEYRRILAHELGHAINFIASKQWEPGQKPEPAHTIQISDEMEEKLRSLYPQLNNGKPSPESRGYSKKEARHELTADAIRAYILNPAALKAKAPEVAALIREYVNANPRLNKKLQFSEAIPSSILGPQGGSMIG